MSDADDELDDAAAQAPRGRFGIWCPETSRWLTTVLGQVRRYTVVRGPEIDPDLDEQRRLYRGLTFVVRQILPSGKPYGG
jgi:hypothetical protein